MPEWCDSLAVPREHQEVCWDGNCPCQGKGGVERQSLLLQDSGRLQVRWPGSIALWALQCDLNVTWGEVRKTTVMVVSLLDALHVNCVAVAR